MKADVHNWKGEKTGSVELNDAIFSTKWNADLVHQIVVASQANKRHPWAHTKGRGEVRGGGIKPWKQKGTGRARHGSIRSPIWRGGGVSHGPTKERDFSQKINKKMLRGALHSVLAKKLADGEMVFIDSFILKTPKTKEVFANLKTLFASKKQVPSTLLVPAMQDRAIIRASRNIPKVKSVVANSLNVLDLLTAKKVVIAKDAVSEIK